MASESIQNIHATVTRLIRHEAFGNLKNLLLKLHPADIASIIKRFEPPIQDRLINLLGEYAELPNLFAELGSPFLADTLSRHNNYEFVVSVLQKLPADDQANLVGGLPEQLSQELLGRLKAEESQEITGLLQYQANEAGRLMTTEIFKVKETASVADAIRSLQRGKKMATIFYIYVVDNFNSLTGVLSIKQLFQVPSTTSISEIMLRDVVRVRVTDPQTEVARLVAQYDLVAIPVVDENGKLKGVITVDDVIDVIKDEAKDNVLKMGQAESGALDEGYFLASLKKRLPWYLALLAGGVITAEVIGHYYAKLPPVGVFAAFIPIFLRFNGIIARQTSTIVIQGISEWGVPFGRILLGQGRIAVVISLLSALGVGGYAFFRYPQEYNLAPAVGVSLLASMLGASFLSLFIPYGLHRLKASPEVATTLLINFLLDVMGLIVYFKLLIAMLPR